MTGWPDDMTDKKQFVVLTDEDFRRLTSEEKLEYLKQAMAAMERLMRQVREGLANPA